MGPPIDRLIEQAQAATRQGRRDDARALFESALHSLDGPGSCAVASSLIRWIAATYQDDANPEAALDCAAAALAVAELSRDDAAIGAAYNLEARVRFEAGDLERAEALFLRARESARSGGELRLAALAAQNLGVIANVRGDLERTLRFYRTGLAELRAIGAAKDVCVGLNNMGMLFTDLQRWVEADAAFSEAVEIATAAGDVVALVQLEGNRAELYIARGDINEAQAACDRAIELSQRSQDTKAGAEIQKHLGTIARLRGDFARAESHFAEAQRIATERHDILLCAETAREQAELYGRLGRNRDALLYLNRSHRLFTELSATRDIADVHKRTGKIESHFLDVVRHWAGSIEAKDRYTQGHCERVADVACAIAVRDGLSPSDLFWFRIGAMIHDVGKLNIPGEVLNKPGKLTLEEWDLVKRHPTAGVELLAEIDFPGDVIPMVRWHHERWDGAGYPDGIAGTTIPRSARMLCIADVYDALTSRRSYKTAMTHERAMDIMRKEAGTQFDPELFEVFEQLMAARQSSRPARPVPEARPEPRPTVTPSDSAPRPSRPVVAPEPDDDAPHLDFSVFVGRDAELQELTRLLESSVAGELSIIAVTGESGVGKSALIGQLAPEARLRAGSLVIGACPPADLKTPYAPWSDAITALHHSGVVGSHRWRELPRIAPELGRVDGARRANRHDLFDEITAYLQLAAASRPIVLVLEDLQQADDASWEVLHHVLATCEHERILICAALDITSVGGVVAERRQRLASSKQYHEVALSPWNHLETEEWLTRVLGGRTTSRLSAGLFAASKGNPLLAAHLLREAVDSGAITRTPETWQGDAFYEPRESAVQDLWSQRLQRLSSSSREILEVAAAAGAVFDPSMVAAASERTDDQLLAALEEAAIAGIVDPTSGDGPHRFAFTHPAFAKALLASPSVDAAALHAQLALTLESLPASHPAPMAWHFERAGVRHKAYAHAMAAGRAADAVYADVEAAVFFEFAARMAADDLDTARALRELAQVKESGGRHAQAESLCDRALALLARHPDSPERLPLERMSERMRILNGQPPKTTVSRCSTLLRSARSASDRAEEAALLGMISQAQLQMGDRGEARLSAERAVAAAESTGQSDLLAGELTRLGNAVAETGEDATASFERALALYRDAGDRTGESLCAIQIGISHARRGEATEAEDCLEAGLSLARTAHAVDLMGLGVLHLGILAMRQGHAALARERLEDAVARFNEVSNEPRRLLARYYLSMLAFDSGDLRGAEQGFEEVASAAERVGWTDLGLGARGGLGLTAVAFGELAVATAAMRRVRTAMATRGDAWFQGRELIDTLSVRLTADCGDEPFAFRLLHDSALLAVTHDAYAAAYMIVRCVPSLPNSNGAVPALFEQVGGRLDSLTRSVLWPRVGAPRFSAAGAVQDSTRT